MDAKKEQRRVMAKAEADRAFYKKQIEDQKKSMEEVRQKDNVREQKEKKEAEAEERQRRARNLAEWKEREVSAAGDAHIGHAGSRDAFESEHSIMHAPPVSQRLRIEEEEAEKRRLKQEKEQAHSAVRQRALRKEIFELERRAGLEKLVRFPFHYMDLES